MKLTHDFLLDQGATIGPQHGESVDLHYGAPAHEEEVLENAAGLVAGNSAPIELTGADRLTLLNRLSTNALASLTPGDGAETFLTDAKGHTLGHGVVWAEDARAVLQTSSGQAEVLVPHIERYILRDDVHLADRSQDWTELLLAGAEADAVAARAGLPLPPAGNLRHCSGDWRGQVVFVGRAEFLGPTTLTIRALAEIAGDLWLALRGAGARPCGRYAAEAVRIASGWPTFGVDISAANLPQEVGRDARAISFQKGCYLGQETVARLDSRGHVNRLLRGLRFEPGPAVPRGLELQADGSRAATVTSAAYSARRQASVALAYVRREHAAERARLSAAEHMAEVFALP